MEITNKYDMPAPFMAVIQKSSWKPNPEHFGVTDLCGPPLVRYLRHRYWDEIIVDARDLFFRFLGQIIHQVLETGKVEGADTERFMRASFDGHEIVGRLDYYHQGKITDYKMMTVEGIIFRNEDDALENEGQLNVYRWLVAKDPEMMNSPVEALEIYGILRNWIGRKAKNESDYPQAPFIGIPVRLWTLEDTERFIAFRLAAHLAEPEICSPKERWASPETWAVYKGSNKRASRLLGSEDEATRWAVQNALKVFRIERRPGADRRCLDYCDVNLFCPYYKEKYANLIGIPEEMESER